MNCQESGDQSKAPSRAVETHATGSRVEPSFQSKTLPIEKSAGHPRTAVSLSTSTSPTRLRELAAVAILVTLCDVTIYRGHGFAGYGLLFLAAPALLYLGSNRRSRGPAAWVLGILLVVLSAKLVWSGTSLAAVAGFFLLVGLAMSLAGVTPHVFETIVFASQTVPAGYFGATQYWRWLSRTGPAAPRPAWINVGMPVLVSLLFGGLFVLANPQVLSFFSNQAQWVFASIRDFVVQQAPAPAEIGFWFVVAWISVGLLRPIMNRAVVGRGLNSGAGQASTIDRPAAPAAMYPAYRNTLLTVIVLFAGYLTFEFLTLWFREFPAGFHYSGYAHEGAAWLTLALALSTALLSLIFRGALMSDRRMPRLRRLAWLWSLENFLLAAAVYHRLYIYVGFNGMTRMRIVGLLGMSAVVVGFVVVLWKISRRHDFVWLMRRHLWTVAAFVYLYAVTPVDMLVVDYNVRRILAGDPAPAVQISVHPIAADGLMLLRPLLASGNETIRDGVRALLAEHHVEAESRATQSADWTAYQLADRLLLDQLRSDSAAWIDLADEERRNAALQRFHDYAYQWY